MDEGPVREDFEDFEIEHLPEIKDLAKLDEPDELYVVPLTRRPFFPGMAAPIVIEVGAYYDVLKLIANAPQKLIGLFLTKKENADVYKVGLKDLYRVGVCARILRVVPIETGGAQVVLNMEKRVSILGPSPRKTKHLKAKVNYNTDRKTKVTKEIKAYSISIITTIKELLKLNPLFKEELQIFLGQSDFTEPGKLADFAVALTTASRKELQDVLETFDVVKRIDKALSLLKKELDLSKLQSSINQKIEATISKTQREFFLKEQLKTIKKELGLEKDDRTVDVEKFEERLKKRKLSEEVNKVIQDEMEKLQVLEPQSAEYSVGRNYLDWLTITPWGILSKETRDLIKAEKILEKDQYGLEDVKAR
ncbi:MAG: Lon protease, partial [Chlamydiae bacterium]|nr:Lon protease [Chlamydiota bacterium]